jgi:membrane fusion protein, multidrug efflux system
MATRLMKRLLAAGALLVLVAGCAAKQDRTNDAPAVALLGPQDIAKVARVDLATGLPVTGTLKPVKDVTITTPYPELIDAVLVKEGEAVRNGQPLARLRTESLAPAAASAEAQRRSAAADYVRMQNLFKEGAVSQRDVESAEAQLRATEALAAYADKRFKEATVRSPFDGVVAKRMVQGGDRLGEGGVMFRVVNTSELELEASVPGETVGAVKVGAPVVLTVSGLEGVTIRGRVARVNATADPATRQVRLYVTVPNRDGRLVGDLFASGRVQLGQVSGVLAVPTAGVRTGLDGTAYAWLVVGGRAEKRPVTAGLRDEVRDLVEVASGVKDGETIITGPIETLDPGQPIQIVQDVTAAPTAVKGAGRARGAAKSSARKGK